MGATPSAPARVAIRVDGGTEIGSGHVMRCLCLAGELTRKGAEILFLCRDQPGCLIGAIEREGYPVERLGSGAAEEARRVLARFNPDWLIVDHYGIAADWERAVRVPEVRVLCIDDLANRPHDCDVLLDQNYFGRDTHQRYAGLVPGRCRLLLGPRYALLQREYALLRRLLPPRSGNPRRVLVFFGGTDATNETAKALRALTSQRLRHLSVDVVLGSNHPAADEVAALIRDRPATALHRDLPTLAGLMFRADLAVGAGGATTSERLCLGLRSVVVTLAENQEGPIAILQEEGAVIWAGRHDAVSAAELEAAVERAVHDTSAVPPLVDGHGAARVGAAVVPPPAAGLRLNRAKMADARLLFDWRNDETARDMSFDGSPISWDSHLVWLNEKLADRAVRIFIGEVDGLPVGQARLESKGAECVLSYGVDPDLRGLGFGRALVDLARKSAPQPPAGGFRATVKAQNEFSKKIFRSLGWHETIVGNEHIYRLGAGAHLE